MPNLEILRNMRSRTGPVIGFFIVSSLKLAPADTVLDAFTLLENKPRIQGLPIAAGKKVSGVLSREKIDNIPSIVGILSEKVSVLMEKDYFSAEFDELACDVLIRIKEREETSLPGGLIIVNKKKAYAGFTSVVELSGRMSALLKQRSPAERSKKQAGGVLC